METSLVEELAVEWVRSTIDDWAHDTVREFVSYSALGMGLTQGEITSLAREVEKIATTRTIITID
jgi:hypothetical protein